jgi:hypothetical protein
MKDKNWFGIPTKRLFNFRTKDMKSILESDWWNNMHLEISIRHCDYPNRFNNRNCCHTDNLKCEDCQVYKLGLYKRESEDKV